MAITVSNKPVDKPTAFLHSPSSIVLTGIMVFGELVTLFAVMPRGSDVDDVSGWCVVGVISGDRCMEQLELMVVVFTSSQRNGSEHVIF